jgi:Flp pilus assembly protein TadG
MNTRQLKSNAGAATTLMTVATFLLGLMTSSMAVDVGIYFNTQNMMQTAANAGAIAGINKLVKSKAWSSEQKQDDAREVAQDYVTENATENVPLASDAQDIEFGYIDPEVKTADADSLGSHTTDQAFASTGGYNALRVTVARKENKTGGQVATLLARLFGITGTDAVARAWAMADANVSAIHGGVRPIYACDAQWKMALTQINQGLASPLVRIYGDKYQIQQGTSWVDISAGCPAPGSGNWGFADLRDGNPGTVGASTIGDWFRNGYPGTVEVGKTYSTKPGNFIGSGPVSDALSQLIINKTEVFLPVVPINEFLGNGSNTQVKPSAFVGFVFTGFKANGNTNSRYVEGYYVKKTCNGNSCSTSSQAEVGGVIKTRLAAAG